MKLTFAESILGNIYFNGLRQVIYHNEDCITRLMSFHGFSVSGFCQEYVEKKLPLIFSKLILLILDV